MITTIALFTAGDGKLSYKEFLSVMKNWQVRGMKVIDQSIL